MAPVANNDILLLDRCLTDQHDRLERWLSLDLSSDVTDLGFSCWDQLHLLEFNNTFPFDEHSDVELHRPSSSSDENIGTTDEEPNIMDIMEDADEFQYLESPRTPDDVLQDLLTMPSNSCKPDCLYIHSDLKEEVLPELSPPSSPFITSLSDSNIETDSTHFPDFYAEHLNKEVYTGLSSATSLPTTTVLDSYTELPDTTGSPDYSPYDLIISDNSNVPLRYKVHCNESSSPLLQPITITVTTDHDYSSADNSDNSNMIQNPNNLLFTEPSSPPVMALTHSKIDTTTTNCVNSSDELFIYNDYKSLDPSIPNKVSHLESSSPPSQTIITPSHSGIKTVSTDFSYYLNKLRASNITQVPNEKYLSESSLRDARPLILPLIDSGSTHSSNYPDEAIITDVTWAVKQEIDPESSADDLHSESSLDYLLSESSVDDSLSNDFLASANDFNLEEFLIPYQNNTMANNTRNNTKEPSKGDDNINSIDTGNSNQKLNPKKNKADVPPEWEQPGPSGMCRFPRTTRSSQGVPEGARGDGRKDWKKPAEKATPSTPQQRQTPIRKSKERSKQLMKLTFDSENDHDQSQSKKRKIDTCCSETNCNFNSGSNYDCMHKQEATSKRIKNNIASQKSRAKKKEEQTKNELELIRLQEDNERLKIELAALKKKWNEFKQLLKRNI